jgi:amino acid permease
MFASFSQLFAVSVIYILITSANIHALLFSFEIYFCDLMIIVAIFMIPVSMFGTPKDFKLIALVATLTACVTCILLTVQIWRQVPKVPSPQLEITLNSLFEAFGTILFSFAGSAVFPIVQSDMANPSNFPKSVVGAYTSKILILDL